MGGSERFFALSRRSVVVGLAATTLWPLHAVGQTPGRRPVIGWLATSTRLLAKPFVENFVAGMADLARVEGRDFEIVYRFAEGHLDRLPALAEELVALKPALIVVGSTPGAMAARQATSTIPIVAATFGDPVGFGLIGSQARPGGNVTGLLNYVDTLPGKLLALAREVLPDARRIGLVLNLGSPQHVFYRRDAMAAATTLGVTLVPAEVRTADDLAGAIAALARDRVDIAVFLQDAMFLNERARLAALAAAARLPALYSFREHVEDGGLMSYGQKLTENYRRVAVYADKVLKGAKPGDLPVEFPTTFELTFNLKTAKALGLTIPPFLLARADEVVE